MFQLNAEGLSPDTRGFQDSRLKCVSMTTRGLLILPRVIDALKKQQRCGCGTVPSPRGLYRPIADALCLSILVNRPCIAEKPSSAPNGLEAPYCS